MMDVADRAITDAEVLVQSQTMPSSSVPLFHGGAATSTSSGVLHSTPYGKKRTVSKKKKSVVSNMFYVKSFVTC